MTEDIRALAVFCGASPGFRDIYQMATIQLAEVLVARGIDLVYGGARNGLMGVLADSVLAGGGRVYGFLPAALRDREAAHEGLTELYVVDGMHARKAGMAARADAFIAMPGGLGTVEELFEVYTWLQLGLHCKPIGLLNVGGFYDPLLQWLGLAQQEGFIRSRFVKCLEVGDSPAHLLDALARSAPPGDLFDGLRDP